MHFPPFQFHFFLLQDEWLFFLHVLILMVVFDLSRTQNHLVPTMILVLLTNHPRFPTNLARASFCCDVGKASAPKPTCSTCNWMFGQKNSQLVEGLWQENQNHTTIRFQDFGTWSWIAASMNLWVKPASWSWGKNRKGARLLDVYWRWAANVLSAWMKQPMRLKKWINCFPLRLARMPQTPRGSLLNKQSQVSFSFFNIQSWWIRWNQSSHEFQAHLYIWHRKTTWDCAPLLLVPKFQRLCKWIEAKQFGVWRIWRSEVFHWS